MVERAFGWGPCWRRRLRDDAQRLGAFEAVIHLAMGSRLLHRIARP